MNRQPPFHIGAGGGGTPVTAAPPLTNRLRHEPPRSTMAVQWEDSGTANREYIESRKAGGSPSSEHALASSGATAQQPRRNRERGFPAVPRWPETVRDRLSYLHAPGVMEYAEEGPGKTAHVRFRPDLPPTLSDKIRPNKVTGCWEWIGARDSRGYGNVKVDGRVRRTHFVFDGAVRGPITAGLECDHLCRVPWCVNPAHMELVAHAENVRRGAARWVPGARQRAKRRCPRGHAYTKANTYVQPSTGGRACRACDRDRKRREGVRGQRGSREQSRC
jgi:hypothetical protein